jgi:hypothetical protein
MRPIRPYSSARAFTAADSHLPSPEIQEICHHSITRPIYHPLSADAGVSVSVGAGEAELGRLRALVSPQMSHENAHCLLEFLAGIVVHEIPEVSPELDPFCLEPKFLLTAHEIAICCVKAMKGANLGVFESPSFLRRLVGMWASPAPEEQEKISEIVRILCATVPDAVEVIVGIVRGRLEAVGQGLESHRLVGSACGFLYGYYTDVATAHDPTDPGWFGRVCLPLFRSHYLQAFYDRLSQLCGLYYGLFEQARLMAAKEMFASWPRVTNGKRALYVEQIGILISRLNNKVVMTMAGKLFMYITDCFVEGPGEAVEAALKLLMKRGFVARFRPYAAGTFPRLYGIVESYVKEGSPAFADDAKAALHLLKLVAPGCGKRAGEAPPNNRIEKWRQILQMAPNDGETEFESLAASLSKAL